MEEWLKKKQDIQSELRETKKKIRKDLREHTRIFDELKAKSKNDLNKKIDEIQNRTEDLKNQIEN